MAYLKNNNKKKMYQLKKKKERKVIIVIRFFFHAFFCSLKSRFRHFFTLFLIYFDRLQQSDYKRAQPRSLLSEFTKVVSSILIVAVW